MKIKIKVDGKVSELSADGITEEFAWHNIRDSNHCREVRRKIFEAVLTLARSRSSADRDVELLRRVYEAAKEWRDGTEWPDGDEQGEGERLSRVRDAVDAALTAETKPV